MYVYIMVFVFPCVDIFTSVIGMYVYIMVFVYPCVNIFTSVIVLYAYIMMFVYPCVDIFTSCDSVVCLHYDVCLSLCRFIYIV